MALFHCQETPNMYDKKKTSTQEQDENFKSFKFVYLRNKETQQTLRVIVSIQYDASF